MQSATFTLPTDREGFMAWLKNWWEESQRASGQHCIPTGDTGGYLSLSSLLREDRRRGAVVLKAELAYMLPLLDDPTCLTCYDGLRGFEWAIVPLGAGRCEVKFTTQDARLLHLYWPALQAAMLRWPDMQFIEIRPPIEGDAPEVQPAGSAPEVQPAGDAPEVQPARDDGATPPIAGGAPKRKTRGTSRQTDDNARDAFRLYCEGLTQNAIAERKSVSVKTVQRWIKRGSQLAETKK